MKSARIISLLLVLGIILSLGCGCSGSEQSFGDESASGTSASQSGNVSGTSGRENLMSEPGEGETESGEDTGSTESGYEGTESTESGESTEGTETKAEEIIPPAEAPVLQLNGYHIIREKKGFSYALSREVDKLIATAKQKLGAVITVIDYSMNFTAKEIVLSGCEREYTDNITDVDKYIVKVQDGKVYLEGGSDRATMMAVTEFRKLIEAGTVIRDGYYKSGSYSKEIGSYEASYYKRTWGDDFNGTDYNKSIWNLTDMSVADIKQEMSARTYVVRDGEIDLNAFNATAADLKTNKDKLYITPRFLTTKGKTEFLYGCFEIKAKIPFYKGNSAAFWFCSSTKTSKGYTSEIDLVELLGSEDNVVSNLHVWGTAHTAFDGKIARANRSYTFASKGDTLRDEWHSYFMDWTPEYIDFGVDADVYYHADITAAGKSQFGSPSSVDMDAFRLPVYFILSEFLYTPARNYNNRGLEKGFYYTMTVDHVDIYQNSTGKIVKIQ